MTDEPILGLLLALTIVKYGALLYLMTRGADR
jgi:hypothetical protein